MLVTSHLRTLLVPLLKLVAILMAIPFLVSYLDLMFRFHAADMCFVGPGSSSNIEILREKDVHVVRSGLIVSDLYGIYHFSKPGRLHSANIPKKKQMQSMNYWLSLSRSFVSSSRYPPFMYLIDEMASSTGTKGNPILAFDTDKKSWCFQKYDEMRCIQDHVDGTHVLSETFPPTGMSALLDNTKLLVPNDQQQTISISCPGKDGIVKFFRNNMFEKMVKNIRKHPNLKVLVERPTTSFIIFVNVVLAFIYWNNRVDVSSVCKDYSKIVHDHELWRSFSGATAHFEPLHIGFNMMSLHALGTELEPVYSSIPFLFYNICLIPLTTVIMMALIRLQGWWTGNDRLQRTKTVGFSSVLFAWMVVSSLERRSTCPVPFIPNLCFKTYEFDAGIGNFYTWIIKFNFGPVVQLFIAQMIMPRVSFVGHLAGILCGFILHWNMLPREIFYMPQVLIPLIMFVHMALIRKLVYLRQSSFCDLSWRPDDLERGNTSRSNICNWNQSQVALLVWIRRLLTITTILSMTVFHTTSSQVISQVLVTLLTISSTFLSSMGRLRDAGVLWRVTVISLFLLIIVDFMNLPYCTVMNTYIVAVWNVQPLQYLLFLFFLRSSANFVALVIACYFTIETSDVDGIFGHVFGWIVVSSHSIIVDMQRNILRLTFSPFQGQGIALNAS